MSPTAMPGRKRYASRPMPESAARWTNLDEDAPQASVQQVLPAVLAATILVTAVYSELDETTVPAAANVWGELPERMTFFHGVPWCSDWFGDARGVWLTPLRSESILFGSPTGFPELRAAIGLLANELRPEMRRHFLIQRPDLDFSGRVNTGVGDPDAFDGRFYWLVIDVWRELAAEAATAHGRVRLLLERRQLLERRRSEGDADLLVRT